MNAPGHLAENVMHFARVLRSAGLPIGPARVIDALRAVEVVGIEKREDFYWTLASVFLAKREHFEVFDQAFHIFWRDPQLLERAMAMLMPDDFASAPEEEKKASSRVSEAFNPEQPQVRKKEEQEEKVELDATLTFSSREVLQHADFETMTADELAQAKALIKRMRLPIRDIRTRRFRADLHGARIDMRATLRASLREGGGLIDIKRRSPRWQHPPLVVLCDISGSMNRYSRVFLHFLHAITNDRDRVHTFVFGTRLTNVTRCLRHRDVDIAMTGVADLVSDWSGGTRIGASIRDFNVHWSRRVLGQNAVVLLITDGLDADVGQGLSEEMDRLHRSCRQLIWLNPLLRYEGFEARPAGIRAMLPHVDKFLPAHNMQSLLDLASVLEGREPRSIAA
ncbi:MAG: VWA domain-containing protein [Betaproteobacteria bacterium]|nr:VWA domain-containing protein [Betaproteobacteria bacterium]